MTKCSKCNEEVGSDVIEHRCKPILLDTIDMFVNPMAWAAKRLAELGKLYSTHDPCTSCGHGRLLHKKTGVADAAIRAADDALLDTACRHGRYHAQEPKIRIGCTCVARFGVETPLPNWDYLRGEPVRETKKS